MDQVDGIIIGAGAVGLAIAARLSKRFHNLLIIDLHPQVGQETSARNSEVIHAGIYYPQDSLKAKLCVRGKHLLYEFCQQHKVPHKRLGKIIVAQANQVEQLAVIEQKAKANDVQDLSLLRRKSLQQLEPTLQGEQALLSPSTGIIDSHDYMQKLLYLFEQNGGFFVGNSEFLTAQKHTNGYRVSIKNRQDDEVTEIDCGFLINSAGLHSTRVAENIEGLDHAAIPKLHYCKGHYFSYSGTSPFQHLIYPVPEANTSGLGIHGTLDMAGQLRFGPDVEYVNELNYSLDANRVEKFATAIKSYWPGLKASRLQASYSGIRPKLAAPGESAKDFMIEGPQQHQQANLINLFGLESPGLTASLAIAEQVEKQLCG